jgi:hypothetical protein
MTVELETFKPPPYGQVTVHIDMTAELHVSATVARQRVSRLVISELGNLLYGGEPTLVAGEDYLCWRVPVILAYPDTGPVGVAGALDVDVKTGEVLATPERLAEISDYAHYLAQRTSVFSE